MTAHPAPPDVLRIDKDAAFIAKFAATIIDSERIGWVSYAERKAEIAEFERLRAQVARLEGDARRLAQTVATPLNFLVTRYCDEGGEPTELMPVWARLMCHALAGLPLNDAQAGHWIRTLDYLDTMTFNVGATTPPTTDAPAGEL
jgi:hypothetical protein